MDTLSLNLAYKQHLKKPTKKKQGEGLQLQRVSVFSRIDFTQFHLTKKTPFDPELCTGRTEAFFQLRTTFENTTQMK